MAIRSWLSRHLTPRQPRNTVIQCPCSLCFHGLPHVEAAPEPVDQQQSNIVRALRRTFSSQSLPRRTFDHDYDMF